jgi:hypothetical protein
MHGGGDPAAADRAMRTYPMYKYFLNLDYAPIYSATEAGFDWKIVWGGFKQALETRL